MNRSWASAFWVTGVVGYLLLEAFAAAAYEPTYSYAHNYISELGLTGPRVHLMHAAFFLQGSMFLLGALFAIGRPRDRRAYLFLALSAANALGNILVGIMHTGKVHTVGAALAIVGGNAAILAGCAILDPQLGWYVRASKIIAALGFTCLFMLLIGWTGNTSPLLPIGAWERGSVYSIFLWQLLTVAKGPPLTCR